MGGSGRSSISSAREISELKKAFDDELSNGDVNANGLAGGPLGQPSGIPEFPMECSDGTVIEADIENGKLIFTKEEMSTTITFEAYQEKYVDDFDYDFCAAAESILND